MFLQRWFFTCVAGRGADDHHSKATGTKSPPRIGCDSTFFTSRAHLNKPGLSIFTMVDRAAVTTRTSHRSRDQNGGVFCACGRDQGFETTSSTQWRVSPPEKTTRTRRGIGVLILLRVWLAFGGAAPLPFRPLPCCAAKSAQNEILLNYTTMMTRPRQDSPLILGVGLQLRI